MSEKPKLGQLCANVTPVPKLNPPLLYVSDPVVQCPPDRPQPAIALRDVYVRMTLKTDGTDPRYNDGGSDTESLEQTIF